MLNIFTLTYGPITTIIAAFVSATLSWLVTRYFQSKKHVNFWICPTQSMMSGIHINLFPLTIQIGGKRVSTLASSNIIVKNTGNTCLKDFSFDLDFVTRDKIITTAIEEVDLGLKQTISVEFDQPTASDWPDAQVRVSVPLFNPGEIFQLTTFLESRDAKALIKCRMEDLKITKHELTDLVELHPGRHPPTITKSLGSRIVALIRN